MKCPDCSSRVDHSNLVNGPNGEEYYVCPNCELNLAHQMSFGKVMLWAVVGLPIIWFVTDFLVAILIGPVVGDAMIMGIETVEAIAFVMSIITAAVLLKHALRLVKC